MIETKDLVRGLQDKTLNTDELSSWDWELVSAHQKLSEGFIEEFSDKMNWTDISISQTLSEDFIEKIIKRQGGTLPPKKTLHMDRAGLSSDAVLFYAGSQKSVCCFGRIFRDVGPAYVPILPMTHKKA